MTRFIDEFKNNMHNWTFQNVDNAEINIDDGYLINNRSELDSVLVTTDISFDFTIPYQISIEIDSCRESNREFYYGVVWNMENHENYLMALFYTDGRYGVGLKNEEKVDTLITISQVKSLNTGVASNKIDITNYSEETKVFINNQLVQTFPQKVPLLGNHIGFIIGSGMKIRVKRLTFDNNIYRIITFIKSHPRPKERLSDYDKMILDAYYEELDFAWGYAQRLADPLDEGRDLSEDMR